MKKNLLFLAVLIFAVAGVARGEERDVLAHASGDWCWFAKVGKTPAFMQMDPSATAEQTEVFARENSPGQPWHSLSATPLPGRVIALASRSSQLAVLMKDGQWMTVWAGGSATGQPLPASGRLLTIADDGTDLWAIGSVSGGLAAAQDAIAQAAGTTRPTTVPTTGPSANKPAVESLVVFRQQNGQWAAVADFPPGKALASETEVSMAVVGGVPMIAFKGADGKIGIVRYDVDHRWKDVALIQPSTQPVSTRPSSTQASGRKASGTQPASTQVASAIQAFSIFSDGFDPYFWETSGNSAGELFVKLSSKPAPIPLDWGKNDPLDGLPAITFSDGFVCLFGPRGPHAEKVVEQRYDRDGKPFEKANVVIVPGEGSDRMLAPWLEIAFLCMLGFLVGSSVFQQWNQTEQPTAQGNPVPAGLFPRFAAGMIDLVPVLTSVAVILTTTTASEDLAQIPSLKGIAIFAAGVLIYLAHTTVAEVWTCRSVGKWLMGLKVVTVDGKQPNQSQLVTRNLLRVVDPLLMILFSPLRQRSADTVAGTMVIEMDAELVTEPTTESDGLAVDQDVETPDSQ
jgi:uncharacterized RDD family membrane protein YckC